MSAAPLLDALLRASLEGAVLALIVAAIVRALPRLPASTRCALWWLVGARLVLALAALPWAPAIPVPMPPAPLALEAPIAAVRRAPDVLARAVAAPGATRGAEPRPLPLEGATLALASLWAVGALVAVALKIRDAATLTRAWRSAASADAPGVRAALAEWLGVARAARAEVRTSEAVATPLVLAGADPRLLLPARALALEPETLRMVVAHEVSHLRRHDHAWSLAPALAECLFWFHPFALWAAREYAQAREEACDADALRLSEAAPRHYGELLLWFGIEPSPPTALAAPFGSSHARHLYRRLSMLAFARSLSRPKRVLAIALVATLAVAAAIPARLVGAPAPHRPVLAPLVGLGAGSSTGKQRVARTAPRELRNFCVGERVGDGVAMSGEFDDRALRLVSAFQAAFDEPAGFFVVNGVGWTTRDTEILAEIDAGLAESRAASRQLSQVSEKIGSLGEALGRIAEQQMELEQGNAELENELDRARDALADEDLSRTERERFGRQIEELESELAARESHVALLEDQTRQLERQQESLDGPQRELEALHDDTYRRDMLAMRALADRLIREGRLERMNL